MTESELPAVIIDPDGGEALHHAELERTAAPSTVFGTDDPTEIMRRTSDVANGLKKFITDQGLSKRIGQSDHIMVEGWQMLGMMLGVTAVVQETRTITDDKGKAGWEAVADLRDRTGRTVGAGVGMCSRSEDTWAKRDDYALRSMAQTRAVGKAFRSVFGFIAKAAGYAPAPAEEMPAEGDGVRTDKGDIGEYAKITGPQIDKFIMRRAKQVGMTREDVESFCKATFDCALEDLPRSKVEELAKAIVDPKPTGESDVPADEPSPGAEFQGDPTDLPW